MEEEKTVPVEKPAVPMLQFEIGGIRYTVGVHFSEESTETLDDKIRKMIRQDVLAGRFS